MPRAVPPAPVRTRTAAARAASNPGELSDQLSALRIDAETPTPARKTARTPLRTSARAPVASTSTLKTVPTTRAPRPVAAAARSDPTREGDSKQAMVDVNDALDVLKGICKTGWRATPAAALANSARPAAIPSSMVAAATPSPSSPASRESILIAVTACAAALVRLRVMVAARTISSRATEIERAACSLVGNLVDLGMYELALAQMPDMRASLLALYAYDPTTLFPVPPAPKSSNRGSKPVPAPLSYAYLLAMPLPTSTTLFDPPNLAEAVSHDVPRPRAQDLIPLVISIQEYTLACLFRLDMPSEQTGERVTAVLAALDHAGNLSDWRRLLESVLPASPASTAVLKRSDSMLSSIFGIVTKGCAKIDAFANADVLLSLRTRALQYYLLTSMLYTNPLKLDAFYDQTRKTFLLYGRHAEGIKLSAADINARITPEFERLARTLVTKATANEGKAWVALCEVVLHVAERAVDLPAVERIKALIGGSDEGGDPEAHASLLCAEIVTATTALDRFRKTKEDQGVSQHIQRVMSTLPAITRSRAQDLSSTAHTKIDKVLERLRFVAVRCLEGDRRPDDMLTLPGVAKLPATQVEEVLFTLIDELVRQTESLRQSYSKSLPPREFVGHLSIFANAVDSLLLLAYWQFSPDDRLTYNGTFDCLQRCLPLVSAPASSVDDLRVLPEALDPVRFMLSGLYKIGGTLYNSSKPESAIRFLERACKVGHSALQACQDDGPVSSKHASALQELAKSMPRRWEVLALSHHKIGDKKAAHSSYVSAILAYPLDALAAIAHAASTTPISMVVSSEATLFKLIQRSTRLAAFELLLPASKVNLRPQLAATEYPTAVTATLLELQLAGLEGSLNKVEALGMMSALIQDLLSLYTAEEYPMRRARTLVRQMQYQCTSAEVAIDLSAAATAAEIDRLCAQENLAHDVGLRSYAPQYLAFSHVWLAFHAHRTKAPTASESTASEARQALRLLRRALDTDIPPSPSVPKISSPLRAKVAVSPKETLRKKAPARAPLKTALKTPLASRTLPTSRRTKTDLLTPPAKDLVSLSERMSTPRRLLAQALLLDDPEHCYEALATMANLLGALGYSVLRIEFLKFLRRLSIRGRANAQDNFVINTALLGHEYVRLGKMARAGLVFSQAESRLSLPSISAPSRIIYLLRYAEYLAVLGNHDRSTTTYLEALALEQTLLTDDSMLSGAARTLNRSLQLSRSATAAGVCSVMLQRRGDLTRSLVPAMQALRLWSRALVNLLRLTTGYTRTAGAAEIFGGVTDPKATPADQAARQIMVHTFDQNSGVTWSVAESLASSMLRVSHVNAMRGSVKAAEYFANAALEFAADVGSPRMLVRALCARAEVRMLSSKMHGESEYLHGALDDIQLAEVTAGSSDCPEAILLSSLRADILVRGPLLAAAHEAYLKTQEMLDTFVVTAGEGEALPITLAKLPPATPASLSKTTMPSPSPGRSSAAPSDRVLPSIQAYLLRKRIGLLRIESKQDESQSLLRQLARLAMSEEDKADELKLLASIQLEELLARFRSDPVLGMLHESVLSMPMLAVSTTKPVSPTRGDSLAASLREVETLLGRAMALSVSRMKPSDLRDLSLQTTALRALQLNVGRPSKSAAADVASVLDLGLAVTLRRDMLDAIDTKLDSAELHDDLVWPALDEAVTFAEAGDKTSMRTYWSGIRERYRFESAEANLTDRGLSSQLPSNWSVVSLHLSSERDSLVLVKHGRDVEPVVFKLPLDRHARREGDEEEDAFTYEIAIGELHEIIEGNNRTSRNGKFAIEKEQRQEWWRERKELNERMKVLTERMEDAWLGAFKSVLLDSQHFSAAAAATFKAAIERIVKRLLDRPNTKAARLKLEDSILSTLSALPPTCRAEDLEDFFYFIMESFQFTGVPVAYDEIDVDQVACDLRAAFEALHAAEREPTPPSLEDHLFLILDKSVQAFPWESIPCLIGRSISRVPSISFLRDRIDLAAHLADPSAPASAEILVDSTKTTFVLNAAGDLKNTQGRFAPWLERMASVGWSGVVGRVPMEEEVKSALVNKELFLYFGHGGAEQYIRSATVRNLPRCAVAMLWGCSSGYLNDLGEFDPLGTPYHYMLAGCSALVANLWDVTDKDIDTLSQTVCHKLGLDTTIPEGIVASETLASAVASARDVCFLRYLNGAAPVVYGVPVRFTRFDGK